MRDYHIILFDLDGTLTESHRGITKSFQYALKKLGIEEPDPDNLIKYVGPPFQDTLMNHYGLKSHQVDQAIEYYRERYGVIGMYENQLFPNVPNLLSRLKEENKILVLATSKLTEFAQKIFKYFHIDQYFDLVVGSNLDGSRLSKTEVLQYALSQFPSLDKETLIMIGDRENDILGAHNVGIDSIAVTYGYGSYKELKRAKPTYFAHQVDDLADILISSL